MIPRTKLTRFDNTLWGSVGLVVLLVVVFGCYIRSETQLNRANELRQRSFLLADELRQSSDDLTRMARTYVITGNPVPLCHVDRKGVLTFRNERFVRNLGYTTADVPTLEEWWRRAYPDPKCRAWVIKTWEDAMHRAAVEGRDIEPIEYTVTCKNGEVRLMEITGILLGEELLALFIDQTERRQAEAGTVDSHALLGQTLVNLRAALDEAGALVTNDDLPEVQADPTQLVQLSDYE